MTATDWNVAAIYVAYALVGIAAASFLRQWREARRLRRLWNDYYIRAIVWSLCPACGQLVACTHEFGACLSGMCSGCGRIALESELERADPAALCKAQQQAIRILSDCVAALLEEAAPRASNGPTSGSA